MPPVVFISFKCAGNSTRDNLIHSFEAAETLEAKIKIYNSINSHINNIETQLFT